MSIQGEFFGPHSSSLPRFECSMGALKVCYKKAQSRRPRWQTTSKSFAEDGERSNLIYKLLAHPATKVEN
jgi:hypothetical protein